MLGPNNGTKVTENLYVLQIKTYDSFIAEVEAVRQMKPTREDPSHRLDSYVLQLLRCFVGICWSDSLQV